MRDGVADDNAKGALQEQGRDQQWSTPSKRRFTHHAAERKGKLEERDSTSAPFAEAVAHDLRGSSHVSLQDV